MRLKKRTIFIIAVVLFLIIFSLYYFSFKKTCDSADCFKDATTFCTPSKYETLVTNNFYKYEISRSLGDYCKISVSLRKASEGTDIESRTKLVGKSMKCLVPKEDLALMDLSEVTDLLKYCTGSLKEGIYEIIIKDMYSIIISNLGEILGEVQTAVIKKI